MLEKKPLFTWRIETQGARYQARMNGHLIQSSSDGGMLQTEEPINHFMRSGINRISMHLFPVDGQDFGDGKISVSLFVNNNGASESEKSLIGQIVFNSSGYRSGSGIENSLQSIRLNSNDNFKSDSAGDVYIHEAKIERSKKFKDAVYVYQDIEVRTPFPLWGYMTGEEIKFPDSIVEFQENKDKWSESVIDPLYREHENVFNLINSKKLDEILQLFKERNTELDIAFYAEKGTHEEKLKNSLLSDWANRSLFIDELEYASPYVDDEKNLMTLGLDGMIYFTNDSQSTFSNYSIWFYKKDGKWIISR